MDEKTRGKSSKHSSLVKKTVEYLRQEIFMARLSPGDAVLEEAVSQKLGTSRAVVREALLNLEGEGLIEKEHYRSARVVSFSTKDVEEIYQIRYAIEAEAMEICLDRGIDLYSALQEKVVNFSLLGLEPSLMAIVNCDLDFHSVAIKLSGNRRMQQMWIELSGQMVVLLYKHLKQNEINLLGILRNNEHERIVQAVEAKDVDYIRKMLKHHIVSVADRIGCS